MKSPNLLIVFIAFSMITSAAFGQNKDFSKAMIAAKKYVQRNANKALVIGIVQDGETKILSFGQLTKNQKTKPDGNTIFEIGAVSGVFTTSLMKLEAQKDRFVMENRIQDYFSDDIKVPNYKHYVCTEIEYNNPMTVEEMDREIISCHPDPLRADACITFCHLASHTAGFKNNPKGLFSWNPIKNAKQKKDPYQGLTKLELYESMKKMELPNPPGVAFRFSNWGVAVLGNLVADIANMPYESLLEKEILTPLALYDTRIELSDEQNDRFVKGHDRKGRATTHWHFQAMAPALGLKSSANDLLKFVQANIYTDNKDLENAFAHIQGAQINLKEKKLGRFTQMGYGWFTSTLNEASNLSVHWINGGTGGYRAFCGFIKDNKTGVVVLSNAANDVDEIGFLFLEGLRE
jgi:CubicO group peptidase (beta-lactamase class C family)